MKKIFFAMIMFAGLSAHAEVYNECTAVNDSQSGIYFENGYAQTSVNSSDHFFENLNLVISGKVEKYKIGGDGLYRADCEGSSTDSSKLNLSKTSYAQLNYKLDCGSAKLEVQLDVSKAAPNGKITRKFKNGSSVTLDLNCK